MQISDIISQMGGLDAVARELGVSKTQAFNGANALVPAILGGFKRQAQSQPAGLNGLSGLLEQLGGNRLEQEVLKPQPTDVSLGDNVLGQIFGSKDVSRAVAQNASTQSGLDPSLLKKMLPMLAMLLTSYMAKQDNAAPAQQHAPEQGGMLGGLLGGLLQGQGSSRSSGLGSLLDINGDGNALDDVLRMVGKAMR